ncbi:hypothetical protein AMECASPLE_025280, partial [Ameca splendens]
PGRQRLKQHPEDQIHPGNDVRLFVALIQTILDLRKEGHNSIPIWIILGSSLGGLLLLCLIIFGLWKLGFFKTQRRAEEEEQPVTNGKAEKQL